MLKLCHVHSSPKETEVFETIHSCSPWVKVSDTGSFSNWKSKTVPALPIKHLTWNDALKEMQLFDNLPIGEECAYCGELADWGLCLKYDRLLAAQVDGKCERHAALCFLSLVGH